jgi:hypothetical protein
MSVLYEHFLFFFYTAHQKQKQLPKRKFPNKTLSLWSMVFFSLGALYHPSTLPPNNYGNKIINHFDHL